MASKVHPSPGAARSVWALPLTASSSCNMVVAEEDGHAHADDIHLDHRPHSPPLTGRGTDGGHGSGGVEDHENVLLFEGLDGATTVSLDDIFDIIKNGEVSEVENLVDKFGMECLSARDRHGYTPAHWIALNGNVQLMRYLIERTAPIDLPCLGTQGPRPIHWACRKGHASVVQVLLQAELPSMRRTSKD
ncbi:GD22128 [Drosophila simulans]|uniref:GD22128 n=1 Tax=Drosophila simulans TaxID=7240 RepID=B4Q3Q5_DROSI|nr:GD22128 [Drosophila simulans]